MLCKSPYVNPKGLPFGCGQCLPCTISRRRIWANRITLESFKHAKNSFVTLTYDDEHLPPGGSLEPRDLQLFLKRLRNQFQSKLRFFACGEYGDVSQRPHYHAAIFGCGVEDADKIERSWHHGHTFTGELTPDSAKYIAGYVTKKMTNPENPHHAYLLSGRHPEFARMSNRPGIGAFAVGEIADTLTQPAGCDALAEIGDVPHALTVGGKSFPLGRYLRRKLREKLHFPETKTPEVSLNRWKAEVQELQRNFIESKKTTSKHTSQIEAFKQFLIDENAQKVLQLETRNKIFSQKKVTL